MPKDPCSYGTSGHPRRGNRVRPKAVLGKNRLLAKGGAGILCPLGTIPRFFRFLQYHGIYEDGMFAAQQQTPLLRFVFLNFSRPAGREPGLYRVFALGKGPAPPPPFRRMAKPYSVNGSPKLFVQYFLQNDFLCCRFVQKFRSRQTLFPS